MDEPFGSQIEDYRAGVIAATVANVQMGEGGTPMKPLDSFPWHRDPADEPPAVDLPPTDDPQELARRAIAALASHG